MSGKTSNESKAKYNAKTYDRINIAVPKGRKEIIKAAADAHGQSINAYITTAIDEKLERDAAGTLAQAHGPDASPGTPPTRGG